MGDKARGGYDYSDLKFVIIVVAIAVAIVIIPSKKEGGFIGTIKSVGDDKAAVLIQNTGEVVGIKTSKDTVYTVGEQVVVYSEDHIFFKRYVAK